MKKNYILFLILGVVMGVAMSSFGLWLYLTAHMPYRISCDNITLSDLKAEIPARFPADTQISSIRRVKGMCEVIVQARGRLLPIYLGKDFALVGQLFSHRKNISSRGIKEMMARTSRQRKQIFLKSRAQIDSLVSFVVKPYPHTRHVIYLFTDPLCPFCHRVDRALPSLASSTNSTIKIIFYPVHIPQGEKVASGVICSGIGVEKYLSLTRKQRNSYARYVCEKGRERVKAAVKMAEKLGINSVPRFILEDGTQVVGANLLRLKRAIARLSKHGSS